MPSITNNLGAHASSQFDCFTSRLHGGRGYTVHRLDSGHAAATSADQRPSLRLRFVISLNTEPLSNEGPRQSGQATLRVGYTLNVYMWDPHVYLKCMWVISGHVSGGVGNISPEHYH